MLSEGCPSGIVEPEDGPVQLVLKEPNVDAHSRSHARSSSMSPEKAMVKKETAATTTTITTTIHVAWMQSQPPSIDCENEIQDLGTCTHSNLMLVQMKQVEGSWCYLNTTSRKRGRVGYGTPSEEQGALQRNPVNPLQGLFLKLRNRT